MTPRRERVRSTIRLAARYVERKANGEPVRWIVEARVTPLDEEGNPSGPSLSVGPVIWGGR